jgi:hypothetical protein
MKKRKKKEKGKKRKKGKRKNQCLNSSTPDVDVHRISKSRQNGQPVIPSLQPKSNSF